MTTTLEVKPKIPPPYASDDFPRTWIRRCAERLNAIADAHQAGVGGPEVVPHLLADAVIATGELRSILVEWGQARGILIEAEPQDAPTS